MKRCFALTLALLLLSIAGIVCAHIKIDETSDQVALRETVVYGDRTAAEGIEIAVEANCDRRLFWNTALRVGAENAVETDFRYSQTQKPYDVSYQESGMWLWLPIYGGRSFSPGTTLEELRRWASDETNDYSYMTHATGDPEAVMYPLWETVANQTPANEERTMTLRLRDYFAYYPLTVELGLRREAGDAYERYAPAAQRFFRIPVPEDESVNITIKKDAQGRIEEIQTEAVDDNTAFLNGFSAVTEDACCWYVFDNSGYFGSAILDTSEIPGGFGIYRLPYTRDEYGAARPDESALAMAYPLDESEAILNLAADEDGRLLLFTAAEGTAYLSVINTEDMALLQRLPLLALPEGHTVGWVVGDDFIYVNGDKRFVVAEQTTDGLYALRLDVKAKDVRELLGDEFSLWAEGAYGWDGARFVIARRCNDAQRYREGGSFVLCVYDGSGLAYMGLYNSSLSVDRPDGSLYISGAYRYNNSSGLSVNFN